MITEKDVKKMKDIIKTRGRQSAKGKPSVDLTDKEKNKKVYMYNRNINDKEMELLKRQGKFTKCPYNAPIEY